MGGVCSTHGSGYKYIRSFLEGGLKKLNEKNRVKGIVEIG